LPLKKSMKCASRPHPPGGTGFAGIGIVGLRPQRRLKKTSMAKEGYMAHIPQDDVRQLFEENKQHNWSGLHQVLQQHKGKAEGIEDSIVDSLLITTKQLEQSKQPYPGSADQMQRVLENELSKITM